MTPSRPLLALALAALAAALPAAAQVKPNATAADVASYAGADRAQKILEGAKKEGQLEIYTSAQSAKAASAAASAMGRRGMRGVIRIPFAVSSPGGRVSSRAFPTSRSRRAR